jgi:hypothetical protein
MSDELKDWIVEAGERLPAGTGDAARAMAGGRRRLRFKRLSYGALSIAVLGAGWFTVTQLSSDEHRPVVIAGDTTPSTSASLSEAPGRLCPNDTDAGLIIDWSNFIRFDGITYQESYQGKEPIPREILGDLYDEVECTIQDHVARSDYEIQDGDAAYLEPHTEVYEVDGYDPSFRLAAEWNGELVIYEANINPDAQKGGDLLDIGGKVERISIEDDAGEKLGTIDDPKDVALLTTMVVKAPVDPEDNLKGSDNLFVTFHLEDGTVVTRAVSRRTAIMTWGIHLPERFIDLLEASFDS